MCELVWALLGKVLKKSYVRIKHPLYLRFIKKRGPLPARAPNPHPDPRAQVAGFAPDTHRAPTNKVCVVNML